MVAQENILVSLVDRDGKPGVSLVAEDALMMMIDAPAAIMEAPLDRAGRDGLLASAAKAAASGPWRDGAETAGSALSSGWPTERAGMITARYFGQGWWGRDLDLMSVSSSVLAKARASRPAPVREGEVSLILTTAKPEGFLSVRYAGMLESRAPQDVRDAWENKQVFLAAPKAMGEAARAFALNPSPADGLTEDPNWRRVMMHVAEAIRGATLVAADLSAWKSSRPHGMDVIQETVLGRIPLSLRPLAAPGPAGTPGLGGKPAIK